MHERLMRLNSIGGGNRAFFRKSSYPELVSASRCRTWARTFPNENQLHADDT